MMAEKKQLWFVETYKGNILEKEKFLADDIHLSHIIQHFCWKYTSYDPERDYITIKPSDIACHVEDILDET